LLNACCLDHEVVRLYEFLGRLLGNEAAGGLLTQVLDAAGQGRRSKVRGRKRLDSMHVPAASLIQRRLELVAETLRAVLSDMAIGVSGIAASWGADGARSKQPMLLSDAWDKGFRRIAAKFFRSDGYGAGIYRSPFLIHSARQHRRLVWGASEHIGAGDRHLNGGLGNQDAEFPGCHLNQCKAIQKDNTMRTILVPAALIAALATGLPVQPAQAAGCIKGAIAGGLAGHVVGHGVLGAAGGCFAGRSIANRSARQQQLEQQNPQNGNQAYTSGGVHAPSGYTPGSSQSQGYASGPQGQGYGARTIQQGPSYGQGMPQN